MDIKFYQMLLLTLLKLSYHFPLYSIYVLNPID